MVTGTSITGLQLAVEFAEEKSTDELRKCTRRARSAPHDAKSATETTMSELRNSPPPQVRGCGRINANPTKLLPDTQKRGL